MLKHSKITVWKRTLLKQCNFWQEIHVILAEIKEKKRYANKKPSRKKNVLKPFTLLQQIIKNNLSTGSLQLCVIVPCKFKSA